MSPQRRPCLFFWKEINKENVSKNTNTLHTDWKVWNRDPQTWSLEDIREEIKGKFVKVWTIMMTGVRKTNWDTTELPTKRDKEFLKKSVYLCSDAFAFPLWVHVHQLSDIFFVQSICIVRILFPIASTFLLPPKYKIFSLIIKLHVFHPHEFDGLVVIRPSGSCHLKIIFYQFCEAGRDMLKNFIDVWSKRLTQNAQTSHSTKSYGLALYAL
jgi:hypothetical protein